MHKYLPWIAIFCSLVAGMFAAEFVSSISKLPVDGPPTQAAAPQDAGFPAKVAFSETGVDFDASLKN
jgi:hypothetical protein